VIGYLCLLMSAPDSRDPGRRIDPWRAVAVEQGFAGEAFAPELPRLSDALAAQDGSAEWPARFDLRFGRDSEARPVVVGGAQLTVRLVCQRCLGEVRVPLRGSIELALVRSDAEGQGLPDHLDPVLVEADVIRPLDLVEDELLLALPQVPRHEQGHCEPPIPSRDGGPVEEPRRENPFAALVALQGATADPGKGSEG